MKIDKKTSLNVPVGLVLLKSDYLEIAKCFEKMIRSAYDNSVVAKTHILVDDADGPCMYTPGEFESEHSEKSEIDRISIISSSDYDEVSYALFVWANSKPTLELHSSIHSQSRTVVLLDEASATIEGIYKSRLQEKSKEAVDNLAKQKANVKGKDAAGDERIFTRKQFWVIVGVVAAVITAVAAVIQALK